LALIHPTWSPSLILRLVSEPVWSLDGFNRLYDLKATWRKGAVKLVIFNAEDFGYWKNRTCNYLLSQRRTIWEIIQEAYVIPDTLNHVTQGELQRYENKYKTLNLITTNLGRNVYDIVAHLETVHDV
jgi:hypothetical protein